MLSPIRGENIIHKGFVSERIDQVDLLSMYISEFMGVPLLTFEQEKEFALKMEAGRAASRELVSGSWTNDRCLELEVIIRDGISARNQLIQANFGLVINISRKYAGNGIPLLDLIQEGNIGLIRAVDKYDHRRGCRFSTLATWWVKNAVRRAVEDKGHLIRISTHLVYKIRKLNSIRRLLIQDLGREPSIEELAEGMGADSETVSLIFTALQHPISLDGQHYSIEGSKCNLLENIPDHTVPSAEVSAVENIMREQVAEAVDSLPAEEMRILKLRYGFSCKEHSLGEISRKLCLSKEGVRQIEARAVEKLRNSIGNK